MKMEAETTKSHHGNGAPSFDTCGICKEVFHSREPKLLPCLHSFCRSCIVPKANESGIVNCPVCHQDSSLSEMIDNVLSIARANSTSSGDGANQEEAVVHLCTGCEESASASSFCTDCSEWLCDQCVQAHRRVRVTKDHTIIPKEKVNSNPDRATITPPLQQCLYCPQHHQEQLKLFCETCDKLTCRDCQLSEHKDHRYQFVCEASDQYKQFLNILLGKIKEKQTYIENAKALIKKRNSEIEEREKVVLTDIKNFAKTLMTEVNTRGKQLVADLHSVCQLKKSQLGYKHDAIVSLSSQLEHALKLAESILQNNNTAVMLSTKKIIVQQLRNLLRTRCEVPNPYHVVDIALFSDAKSLCSQIACQGKLMVDGSPYGLSNQTPPVSKPSSRPLQPIAPKVSKGHTHGPLTPGVGPSHGGPPNLPNLTPEQRAALMKQLAVARLQCPPGSGSSSPTSTMTGPNLNPRSHSGIPTTSIVGSGNINTSSNGGQQGGRYGYNPLLPQSNKVSSTQVVKTSGVFYPASTHPPGSSKRRTLTVQEQLQQQRQQKQERYQQHLANLKNQMDKMSAEIRNQYGGSHQQLNSGARMNANPIIIQPSSSTGPYLPPNQTAYVSQSSNGRDQLTPSPSRQTSPFSADSRNNVSPAGSGSDGYSTAYSHTAVSDDSGKPSSSGSGVRTDDFSHMIGPDGALCIKPETPIPTSADQAMNYQNQDDFLKMIQSDMKEGGLDLSNMPPDGSTTKPASGLISDPSVETTQTTPPPGVQLSANNDQPYNLCKPITDQVIDSQGDSSGQVLDLRTSTSSGAGSNPKPVLSSVNMAPKETTSEPLPLREPDDPSDDYCAVCHNGGELLCCDTCPKVFHLTCHVPTLNTNPSGTWSCGLCTRESELRLTAPPQRPSEATGSKRRAHSDKLLPEELKVCHRILLELFTHEASLPFHEPVPKSVPNYHKIISQPMDLASAKFKLGLNLIGHSGPSSMTLEEFLSDIQLIMANCTKFNGTESEVGQAGVALEKFFHSLVLKYLPYFKTWVEGAHKTALQEPKAKRRKREASGKEPKEAKPKEKGDGEKKDRRSPTVREKMKKQHDKMPLLLPPLSHLTQSSKVPPPEFPGEELDRGNILSNLGLVRSTKDPTVGEDSKDEDGNEMGQGDLGENQESAMDEGPVDLPSDPVCDPNDENIDSSQGIACITDEERKAEDGNDNKDSEAGTDNVEEGEDMSVDDAPEREILDDKDGTEKVGQKEEEGGRTDRQGCKSGFEIDDSGKSDEAVPVAPMAGADAVCLSSEKGDTQKEENGVADGTSDKTEDGGSKETSGKGCECTEEDGTSQMEDDDDELPDIPSTD